MKKIWLAITCMIISALLINVISADTGTYILVDYITESNYKKWNLNSITGYTTTFQQTATATTPQTVRATTFNCNTGTVAIIGSDETWSTETMAFKYTASGGGTSTTNAYIRDYTQNNKTYRFYIGLLSGYTYTQNETYSKMLINKTFSNITAQDCYKVLYENAIDPSQTYSDLIISYAQNIRTTGNGADNTDLITWNAYRDTAGNDLQGKKIEIQAIAGYFEGSSYADLKTSLFSDWQASTHPAVTMYKGDIDISRQEYTWENVAYNFRSLNTLGTWFWNIFADNGTWYQYGWRYRARLLDENEEPLTEWQTLYTGNSYTPSATETLTDDEPLTPDDVETINDINEQNNTTNNWYINNTVINNNEYNQTFQQNIIENIYNVLTGTPDPEKHQKANDIQQTIDNAIDTEDNYLNDLSSQLTNLDLPDISQQTGLLKALRWVREVHKETIEETLLAPIVLVILTIGLITYLIGRRNG